MELPDDVLRLVKEYAMPITRPDWRKLHRMDEYKFHLDIAYTYNEMNIPCINSYVHKYEKIPNRKYIYLRYKYVTRKPVITNVFLNR